MGFGHLSGVPWHVLLAAAQVVALVFWKPLAAFGQWLVGIDTNKQSRIARLEDIIDALRRALDKGRVRENAIAAVCELLIFAIDHLEEPSAAIVSLRARAQDVLELARAHLQNFERGEQ